MAMKVELLYQTPVSAVAAAMSKSHGKVLPDDQDKVLAYINKWLPKHRNVAEHIVYSIDISGISRRLSEVIGETQHGFTMTEMSQRYRKVVDFAYDHPFNEIAFKAYNDLLEEGVKKEDARYILPVSAACDMVITANREAWFTIMRNISLLGAKDAPELYLKLIEILGKFYDSDMTLLESEPAYHNPVVEYASILMMPRTVDLVSYSGSMFIVNVSDMISTSCYQQLKRHRTRLHMTKSTKDSLGYYWPHALRDGGKVTDIYAAALDAMPTNNPIALNASLLWVNFSMDDGCWIKFIHERCGTHAQKEIRDKATSWSNEVRSQL